MKQSCCTIADQNLYNKKYRHPQPLYEHVEPFPQENKNTRIIETK
jgi:hypothetical protein